MDLQNPERALSLAVIVDGDVYITGVMVYLPFSTRTSPGYSL